jgi:hypothetical protein
MGSEYSVLTALNVRRGAATGRSDLRLPIADWNSCWNKTNQPLMNFAFEDQEIRQPKSDAIHFAVLLSVGLRVHQWLLIQSAIGNRQSS